MCDTIGRDSRIDDITARFKSGHLPIPPNPLACSGCVSVCCLFTEATFWEECCGPKAAKVRVWVVWVEKQGHHLPPAKFGNPSFITLVSVCLRRIPSLDITSLRGDLPTSTAPSSRFSSPFSIRSVNGPLSAPPNYFSVIPSASK